jgi:hypothetical protein
MSSKTSLDNTPIASRTRYKKVVRQQYPSMFDRWFDDPTPISNSIEHPKSWNIHTHYGMCGQSCSCCRAKLSEIIGACTMCMK